MRILRFSVIYVCLAVTAILPGCDSDKKLFKKLDVVGAGITFENTLNSTDDFNIIDYLYFYNGGGIAIGDINDDGLPDIFFSGNQVKNKLYLNKGNLLFEDISAQAGIEGNSTWNTGSVMADVNGDGLLDIYVCAVVGLKNLRGHNELYINNGDNTFSERSEEFGLDFDSYSSSAAFLDFDLDGDLDMYLLNHAVHTSESFGNVELRNKRSYETGDKLLRNDNGKFVDISEAAGIYGGINGYGLGIAVSDFNMDGYPDIYVGNDFHEDDYYYINNGDGTFSEKGRSAFTYTSRFSMGSDVADINHDGLPDLISLDMLPEDETVLKRSEGDENINTLRMRTDQYGYYYQFERNMLQVNQGNGEFAETGLLSSVAATDWSWSAIFSDFDQDGNQDLFISNGIPHRPNDLDYIKYVSNEKISQTMDVSKIVDQEALSLMPGGEINNYVFKGTGDYGFQDMSTTWLPNEKTCSTATAIADLDNDGDLDVVVSNVNNKPGIYINQTNEKAAYLKIKLKYDEKNTYAIGSKVYAYKDGKLQYKEMFTVRGFQSSSQPMIHFGFGNNTTADSVSVVWPNGKRQTLREPHLNQTLEVKYDETSSKQYVKPVNVDQLHFEQISQDEIGLTFEHKEDEYTDFDRLKLLPYQQSDKGPATAVGDINNDGLDDIYFGGSKRIPSQIFIHSENKLKRVQFPVMERDSIKEDIDAVIADFNGDGKSDLYVGTGGADFYAKAEPLLDSYYKSSDTGFKLDEIKDYYENVKCVRPFDYDGDGDLDIFVGSESVSNDFGKVPRSYLLQNENGSFKPVQSDLFANLGMVTDAVWEDFDGDGKFDLVVVGEWMKPVFLKSDGSSFKIDNVIQGDMSGLWQSVSSFDIDQDGDQDFVLGNWGLNSKYKASASSPMKMYYSDFDKDGKSETIIAIEKYGKYYPLDAFDMLASQIVSLHKKFTSYKSFAGKTIEEIFTDEQLGNAKVYDVHNLASGYLVNNKGTFSFKPLPMDIQLSPVLTQLKYDFDKDGEDELLLAGNYFGVQPFNGRFGSFGGALVDSENRILTGNSIGLNFINKSVRHLNVVNVGDHRYLIVTVNNDKAQVYKLLK
ncbi:MAG: VCBS repeat-containing protein [Cyclobacteriaceae bacterium]|nr:VCBS repeat-containing protein [Cyclobacteriaceae bacterium]